MSQNSLVVANGTGASVRSALNNALDTLKTQNSGSSAPGTTSAYMLWADTANDLLKIRNAANTGWITIGRLGLTNLGLSPIPRGEVWGMGLSRNGSDAANDVDVAAGSCASDDAADANRVLLNPGALTKQIDAVWAAGNAAGGRISSESLVNGLWHVFAFRRSGGADDVCFSQSLTPTLPDSGTNKRRIGSVLRESGSNTGTINNADVSRSTTTGIALTKNPVVFSSTTTQAHGLGVEPTSFKIIWECLTAEHNWSVGDRIVQFSGPGNSNAGVNGMWVWADATNVNLGISGNLVLGNKTTWVMQNMTAANWKIIVTPYVVNP